MTSRILAAKDKLRTSFTFVNTDKLKFPERFKGTILEKWANYWKNLFIDYKEVIIDTGKDIKSKPVKAACYGTIGFSSYLCAKRNPDEDSFITKLKICNSQIYMVPESCRNPETLKHLKFLERCRNEGIVRRLSLGVVSVVWIDNYDKGLAIYKAMCPYLKPDYLSFHNRIVDIGFWNRWWKLSEKMIDYDVNF